MAKQVSVIQFTGKLGPTVGFRGSEGKVLMRQRLDTIANPQTEEQVAQRARFKLTSQVSGMLGDVGRVALQANGYKGSQRGILNQMIMPSVAVSAAGEAELNHVLQLIKKPALINHVVTASVKTATTVDGFVATGVLEGLAEGEIATKAILIYDKTDRRWIYNSATGTDDNINIPVTGLTVDDVNIYFYAVLATPTTSKGRAIYESVTGPDTNYKLLASRLSSSNFAYSRMLTAANINGQSTTDKEGYDKGITFTVVDLGDVKEGAVLNIVSPTGNEVTFSVAAAGASVILPVETGEFRIISTNLIKIRTGEEEAANPLYIDIAEGTTEVDLTIVRKND